MKPLRMFDSLVHTTHDGSWLGGTRYDASFPRLEKELDRVAPCRACLVAIAGHVDNETVMSHANRLPDVLVPVGSINPAKCSDEDEVAAAVRGLANAGFRGLKLHPRLGDYDPLDPRSLAAMREAGRSGLVIFLDTLFRQRGRATRHPSDVIDQIAVSVPDARIVLLHGGGPAMLEIFDLVRMHAHLTLDVSFSMMRYAGSSIDDDLRFVFRNLDQRVTMGSDFPEYTPEESLRRFADLTRGLPEEKRERILYRNLDALFPTRSED